MKFKQSDGQLARWLGKLLQYDRIIIQRPDKDNGNADYLLGLKGLCDNPVGKICQVVAAPPALRQKKIGVNFWMKWVMLFYCLHPERQQLLKIMMVNHIEQLVVFN